MRAFPSHFLGSIHGLDWPPLQDHQIYLLSVIMCQSVLNAGGTVGSMGDKTPVITGFTGVDAG